MESSRSEYAGGTGHLPGQDRRAGVSFRRSASSPPPVQHESCPHEYHASELELRPLRAVWDELRHKHITTLSASESHPNPLASLQSLTTMCRPKCVRDEVFSTRREIQYILSFYEEMYDDAVFETDREEPIYLCTPDTVSAAVTTLCRVLLTISTDTDIGTIYTALKGVRHILSAALSDLQRIIQSQRSYPAFNQQVLELKEPMHVLEDVVSTLNTLYATFDQMATEHLQDVDRKPPGAEDVEKLFSLVSASRGEEHAIVRFLQMDEMLLGDTMQELPLGENRNLASGLASIAYMAELYVLGQSSASLEELRFEIQEIYERDLAPAFARIRATCAYFQTSDDERSVWQSDEESNHVHGVLQKMGKIERWIVLPLKKQAPYEEPGDSRGNH